jgi:hypothetical protein
VIAAPPAAAVHTENLRSFSPNNEDQHREKMNGYSLREADVGRFQRQQEYQTARPGRVEQAAFKEVAEI